MFVIELIYKVDLKLIDAHMKAHNKHYAAGTGTALHQARQ